MVYAPTLYFTRNSSLTISLTTHKHPSHTEGYTTIMCTNKYTKYNCCNRLLTDVILCTNRPFCSRSEDWRYPCQSECPRCYILLSPSSSRVSVNPWSHEERTFVEILREARISSRWYGS